MMGRRVIIGITGAMASGKTTVADMFVEEGAFKIDADAIAHDILKEDNCIKQEIVDYAGEDVLTNGEIDRRKLAKEVFFNKTKLEQLCRITHPAIIEKIKEMIERTAQESIVVIDAPLLIETGLHECVDVIVVVTATEETQTRRAINRGISEEEFKGAAGSQMALSEKKKFADYVIDTEKKINVVKKGVEKIWKEIKKEKENWI
ncbi:MAG: dephospho-CoA kinase [Candidatus Omnitrophota bacterium]